MIIPSGRPSRDVTTPMRQRLMSNRDGRLNRGQWANIITDPIFAALILISPLIVILGPRFKYLFVLDLWLLVLLLAVVIGVPLYRRAQRYRAAPMRFAVLRSPDKVRPRWKFWQEDEFLTDDARRVRFKNRLAPTMALLPDAPYLVYYLEEGGKKVLLSYAPADHPQASFWRPTAAFNRRQRH